MFTPYGNNSLPKDGIGKLPIFYNADEYLFLLNNHGAKVLETSKSAQSCDINGSPSQPGKESPKKRQNSGQDNQLAPAAKEG